jgi:Tol biopolymer transport system component
MLTVSQRVLRGVVLALAAFSLAAGPVSATPPGTNGRIAFMRFDQDGDFQVWAANPDLSQQVQLTSGPSDAWFPSWSPDGTRIAFSSHRTDPDPDDAVEVMDVFTMRADGTDVRQVTDSVGFSSTPAWSPDGRWLVISADRADYPRSQGIYIVPSDGSAPPRRLTTLPDGSGWQELARFSPDGSRIVFSEYRSGHETRRGQWVGEQAALFTVRPDGTELTQVTPWGIHATDADWSPDGRRLVFGAQPTHLGNIGDVGIVDADGTHLRDLTGDHGLTGIGNPNAVWYEESFNPAWSPDGKTIIFVHARYTAADGFAMGLQVMNPDGSGRHWVATPPAEEHQPDWGTAPLQ